MVELQQPKAFRVIVQIGIELQPLRVVQRTGDPFAVAAPHRQAVGVVNLRMNGVAHAAFVIAAGEHAGHRRDAQLLDVFTRVKVVIHLHHHAFFFTADNKFIRAGHALAVQQRVDHERRVAGFRRFKPERGEVRELLKLVGKGIHRQATRG